MDLFQLGKVIEAQLMELVDSYELLGDMYNKNEGSWFFVVNNPDYTGFISYEDNKADHGFPTVSIAISLMDTTNIKKAELMDLFALNGDLVNASFSIQAMDKKAKKLFINRRIQIEYFNPKEIREHINDLIFQTELFLKMEEN